MTAPSPLFVFRELPGIAALSTHPGLDSWARERPEFLSEIDDVSMLLFGVTPEGCDRPINSEVPESEWYLKLMLASEDFEAARPVWELMGWDVSDGAGAEHPLLFWFGRQILCAVHGLAGTLPDEETLAKAAAEAWAEGVAHEAAVFNSRRMRVK